MTKWGAMEREEREGEGGDFSDLRSRQFQMNFNFSNETKVDKGGIEHPV